MTAQPIYKTACLFVAMLAVAVFAIPSAHAQSKKNDGPPVVAAPAPSVNAQNPAMPDRLARPMQAIDPVTLRAEGVEIRLWGLSPIEGNGALALRAMDRLDQVIGGQIVSCRIEGGTIPVLVGRCTAQGGQDLGLALLSEGLAMRNRRQTYNTAFASAYGQAEEFARLNQKGVWSYLKESETQETEGKGLSPSMQLFMLTGVPMIGLAGLGLIMWIFLQRMSNAQRQEFERARKKESVLVERERNVLMSTLEGELLENKDKIDAFISIYSDMLRSLRDISETPKYQKMGDIIQKNPGFSRTVFDANANRLSSLGIKLAGRISKLYASLPRDQEYINLDASIPLETAVQLVEKVIEGAASLQEPISVALVELQQASQSRPDDPQSV